MKEQTIKPEITGLSKKAQLIIENHFKNKNFFPCY